MKNAWAVDQSVKSPQFRSGPKGSNPVFSVGVGWIVDVALGCGEGTTPGGAVVGVVAEVCVAVGPGDGTSGAGVGAATGVGVAKLPGVLDATEVGSTARAVSGTGVGASGALVCCGTGCGEFDSIDGTGLVPKIAPSPPAAGADGGTN